MLDRRRDVNIAQGIVVAVLGLLSTGWGWLMYRNVPDALRSGFQGLVLALFTTGLFIMVMGMLAKLGSGRGPCAEGRDQESRGPISLSMPRKVANPKVKVVRWPR
jgi:hypothetical protein